MEEGYLTALPLIDPNRSRVFVASCEEYGALSLEIVARTILRVVKMATANAPTPAANRPVVAMLAGKRTVRHSGSRIRFAVAHGLTARVSPAEICRLEGAADSSR